MIYVDSSALVKLAIRERESARFAEFIAGRQLASSALTRTETLRTVARHVQGSVEKTRSLLLNVELVSVSDAVLNAAATLPPVGLRSLDAIHVATALELSDELECLVSYDARMLEAAVLAGIPVASPGA